MRTKRIDEIELNIREKKSVSLDTLCEVFNVSKNTVRRDIATLEQSGKIKKVYGGVTIADTPASKTLLPFSKRHQSFMKEKRLISQLAASHVCDHDTIFIDSGTTCHNIIDFIAEKECTILTNSLQVSLKAIPYENLNVISQNTSKLTISPKLLCLVLESPFKMDLAMHLLKNIWSRNL